MGTRSAKVYRACGGTASCGFSQNPSRVYPRACGGTDSSALHRHDSPGQGSIPARAGEPGSNKRHDTVSAKNRRSIPARAGEPSRQSGLIRSTLAGSIPARAGEPLVRCRSSRLTPAQGLSPRVRGNHRSNGFANLPWVYPRACGVCRAGWGRPRVYPRACGGTLFQPECFAGFHAWGLSPRVRGNRNNRLGRAIYGLSPRVRGNALSSQ